MKNGQSGNHPHDVSIHLLGSANLNSTDSTESSFLITANWPGGPGLLKIDSLTMSGVARIDVAFAAEGRCGTFIPVDIPLPTPLPETSGTHPFSAPAGMISFAFLVGPGLGMLNASEWWLFSTS